MSQLKLLHSGGNGVILAAPTNNPASDITFKLPQADGTSGQALTTNASGQLAFATVGGGVKFYKKYLHQAILLLEVFKIQPPYLT